MHRWFLGAAFAALTPLPAAPQALSQTAPAVDSAQHIRGIEIQRHNIFSPSEARGFIPRLANSLHVTTRPGVVRREFLFRPGEAYDAAQVSETARNLRGLGVFRSVRIDTVRSDTGLLLRVTTADGWSTKPDFRFRSTASSIVYTLSVEESNFLGTATLLALRYRKTPDRSSVTASFRQPRLLAGRVGLTLLYEDRSDGSLVFAQLSRPYFSLSQRSAWLVDGQTRKETVLRFFEGAGDPGEILQRRYSLGYGTVGWALRATPSGYLRVGVMGHLRRDDYADQARLDTLGHHVTGAAGAYVQLRSARFLVSRGLEGFGREQDVDISTIVGVGLYVTPRPFGYQELGVGPSLTIGTGFGNSTGFVRLLGQAAGRVTPAGLDSGSVHLSGTAFLLPRSRHMAVLHAAAGWQEKAAPGAEFDLGLGVGPRAFTQHAFTGNRAFFTSAEYRWTAVDDFLKLTAIGVAGFIDYGGAWYHGARQRTGWNFGAGLRFGPTRSTNVESNRIDVAYRVGNDREKGGWVFVVGRGFAFSSSGRLDQ